MTLTPTATGGLVHNYQRRALEHRPRQRQQLPLPDAEVPPGLRHRHGDGSAAAAPEAGKLHGFQYLGASSI